MSRQWGYPLLLVALVTLGGCLGENPGPMPTPDSSFSRPPFGTPVALKTQNGEAGSEPSLTITPDGTIFVCSPRGSARGTNVWRSTDHGETFESLGTVVQPVLGPQRSTTGDVGGGDCHMSADRGGTIYLADLWGGSVSLSWSKDKGTTWEGVPFTVRSGTADRPWVLGGDPGEVFVTTTDIHGSMLELLTESNLGLHDAPASGGIWVARSTDGGRTFPQQVLAVGNADRFPPTSNLAEGNGNLYLYYVTTTGDQVRHMVAVSKDRGLTWAQKMAGEMPYDRNVCSTYPLAVFPVVGADDSGGVYLASAYENPVTKRWDLVFVSSPDAGETWNAPILLADREGTRSFPWLATAGNGRVALAWYESNQTIYSDSATNVPERVTCGSHGNESPSDWFIRYAESHEAMSPNPTFVEALVQPTPVTRANDLGRPFAELLGLDFDAQGRAAVAYVSDTSEAQGQAMFALRNPSPAIPNS